MRFKNTIILVLLNLITFGTIWFLDQRNLETESDLNQLADQIREQIKEAPNIIFSGEAINLTHELVREGDQWLLSKPVSWPANYFAVNRILNQLQFMEEETSFEVQDVLAAGQTLADYGFEPPLLTINLKNSEQSSLLSLGTPTEIGNKIYLLGPTRERIHVIKRESIDSLFQDLNALRSRAIFELPVFEVDALGLELKTDTGASSGSLKMRLVKEDNSWQFEAPFATSADPALVASTINTLSSIQVIRFVEENSSDPIAQGLDAPKASITLYGNNREQTLLVGNPDPSAQGDLTYFAQLEGRPTVFTIPGEPIDALRDAQQALRKRNFFEFDLQAADSIRLSEGTTELRLQKLETGDWQVMGESDASESEPERADTAIVSNLLSDLNQLRAIEFVMDAPSPSELGQLRFNTPRRKLQVEFPDSDPLILLLAHPEGEETRLFAQAGQAPFVYEVERRSMLELLNLNPLHYRNRVLEQLPTSAEVIQISLKPNNREPIVFNLDDTASENLNSPKDLSPDQTNALKILTEFFKRFEIKNYLSTRFDPEGYESTPWQVDLIATILLPDGNSGREITRRYRITDRLSGMRQIGGSPEHHCAFELKQELIDALYVFLEDMPKPPEATGDPVETPSLPALIQTP